MTVWLEGESGAVLTFGTPLPAGVQDRLDKGILRRVPAPARPPRPQPVPDAADSAPAPAAGGGDPAPPANAPKQVWVQWAVRQGMPREKAGTLSLRRLKAELGI